MPARVQTEPRKSPRQERAKATVDAILAATARILVKEGYEGASTNRIAEAAGVSVGSLYQYFPSKESLVAELIERHSTEMFAVVTRILAAEPAKASLRLHVRDIIRALVDAHKVDPKLHRVVMEQVPRVGALKRLGELEERTLLLIRTYLEQCASTVRPKNLELAAFVLTMSVEAITHAAVLLHPEYLGEGLIDETTELVVRYLER